MLWCADLVELMCELVHAGGTDVSWFMWVLWCADLVELMCELVHVGALVCRPGGTDVRGKGGPFAGAPIGPGGAGGLRGQLQARGPVSGQQVFAAGEGECLSAVLCFDSMGYTCALSLSDSKQNGGPVSGRQAYGAGEREHLPDARCLDSLGYKGALSVSDVLCLNSAAPHSALHPQTTQLGHTVLGTPKQLSWATLCFESLGNAAGSQGALPP